MCTGFSRFRSLVLSGSVLFFSLLLSNLYVGTVWVLRIKFAGIVKKVRMFGKLVKKIEGVELPFFPSVCASLFFFVVSFFLICKGKHNGIYGISVQLFIHLAVFLLIFTKSKSFGSHISRMVAFLTFCTLSRTLRFVLPAGESRWYGDCWVSDGGSLEIEAFFSLLLAYVSYFAVRSTVRKNFLPDCCSEVINTSGQNGIADIGAANIHSSIVLKLISFFDKFCLPNRFGIGLFIICCLGHVFFGFTNAHLYNASLYYANPVGVRSAVGDIFAWHIMDVVVFFSFILIGILSFKSRYFGAKFVRFFTFLAFVILNVIVGYFYNLNLQGILTVLGITAIVYLLIRFFLTRLSANKCGGVCNFVV